MFIRINCLVVWECDDCGTELETDTEDFDEALVTLKDEGWRTTKEDDEWQHWCQDCWAEHEQRAGHQ